MKSIKDKINNNYRLVKNNPWQVLKRPDLLMLCPLFLVIFINKRWKTDSEKVYLTETFLNNHRLIGHSKSTSYEIREYRSSAIMNVKPILQKRSILEKKENYCEQALKRLDSGDSLFVLIQNHEPVSYLFVSINKAYISQFDLSIAMPNDCFAIYDVYTFPGYRNIGCYFELLSMVCKKKKTQGFKRFWLWLMEHNQVSIITHNSLDINKIKLMITERYRFGVKLLRKKNQNRLLTDIIHE